MNIQIPRGVPLSFVSRGDFTPREFLIIPDREVNSRCAAALGVQALFMDGSDFDGKLKALPRGFGSVAVLLTQEYDVARIREDIWCRFSRHIHSLMVWCAERKDPTHLMVLSTSGCVLSSLLEGMARSVALEVPRITVTTAKISTDITPENLSLWLTQMETYRGRDLYISPSEITQQTYEPFETINPQSIFHPNDNVLILGGHGGVGQELCRALSTHHPTLRLFVSGRRQPTAELTEKLKACGVKSYFRGDVTDKSAMEGMLAHIQNTFGDIGAIFNLAGVLDDGLLVRLTSEQFEAVLRPKLQSAIHLAALRPLYNPRFVVHFSSLTSVLGNIGQSAYGAANAFLDRVAAHYSNWYTINWGFWASSGMQMEGTTSLIPMEAEDAYQALVSAIGSGQKQTLIYTGELPKTLQPELPQKTFAPSTQDRSSLLAQTRAWLREIIIRHSGLKTIDDEDNLLDKGLDSVGSIRISTELMAQLSTETPLSLSRAILFECPTIATLADHLMERASDSLSRLFAKEVMGTPQEPTNSKDMPAEQVLSLPQDHPPNSLYRDEDIAIIGLAGEFPNGATYEDFWQSLSAGEDSITPIPADRWDWRRDYSPSASEPGKTYGRHGGFLPDAYAFDPTFFSITPGEADQLDPQERRFLQISYQALEDSGFFRAPTHEVGVYVAAMFGHYQNLDATPVISASLASIANRVSYTFDFHGPSVGVDTMCSGAMTALHMAITSLRNGECRIALAGGVNIMPHKGKYRLLAQGRFLSSTGHCHSFGVEADGYVPGEAVAAVILKPVAHAIQDGDHIYGIIRATALNAGGRTSGFTVPSLAGQKAVVASALAKADIAPEFVTYIEAHGTGTPLGDPIEIQALQAVYGKDTAEPCALGSIKSNIGHLESAAAMAGLFKILGQFAHKTLVCSLHCAIENPYLNLKDTRFRLVKEKEPWAGEGDKPRYAALSSFGAGGANGHMILQEYVAPQIKKNIPQLDAYIIPLSAPSQDALERKKKQLSDFLEKTPNVCLYTLSSTLCLERQHFKKRVCYVVQRVEDLCQQLADSHDQVVVIPSIRAREYLEGGVVDFSSLFPVRTRMRLPHYPFARTAYFAESLKPATPLLYSVNTPHPHDETVWLTPTWKATPLTSDGLLPSHVVILSDKPAQLPDYIGATKVIAVSAQSDLSSDLSIDLSSPEEIARLVDTLKTAFSLSSLHWITLHFPWTEAHALGLAQGLQKSKLPLSLLDVCDPKTQELESRAMGHLLKGLALENSHIRWAQMDYSISSLKSDLSLFVREVAALDSSFTHLRYTAERRWVQTLIECKPAVQKRHSLRKDGVYLITGGLGMIGRALAEYFMTHTQARVILVGRSEPSREKEAWLKSWEGRLFYRSADITDSHQVHHLIGHITTYHGGLHGVIHSAGVLRDKLIPTKTLEDIHAVWSVKVQGARNLDEATAHLPLDFFALFSSISSLLGNVGQSDYVAANTFLDFFAAERNARTKNSQRTGHTLSINWPLWMHLMESYTALGDYLRTNYGFAPLALRQGIDMFVHLMDSIPETVNQVMTLTGDRKRILETLCEKPKASLPQKEEVPSQPTVDISSLQNTLTDLVCAVTKLTPSEYDLDKTWGEMGMNSLMLQTLAKRISQTFGVQIPANALFSHDTTTKMATYIQGKQSSRPKKSMPEKPASSSTSSIQNTDDRYAIIGINGMLPGGPTLDDFWQLLMANKSAIQSMAKRWPESPYYGGLIDPIDHFDAKFFNLSAREAMLMDPQHRLFLQTAYNAFLDSGYAPNTLQDVGVFAGVQFTDYQTLLQNAGQGAHAYAATGNAHTMLANRVSYLFDFRGPSQTIDTACSSALTALNRALQSLKNGECSLALVGAVSLLIDPAITDAAQSMGVLSPDSRCATFDANANGYVRGEGVGCVVVKALSEALRDGDHIYAVIESCSENHGGHAHSLTAPNPRAQTALLQKAYTPELARQVSYLETHGTGTQLGDPIEIDALKQAWSTLVPDSEQNSLWLGSVKTNVGHLEPAAGIASLMKVLLCFKHGELPANIHFSTQNPLIDFTGSPFQLLIHNQPWTCEGARVAGISSFGFGGSNAHVVLSEAPKADRSYNLKPHPWLVTLSAKSAYSLTTMCDQLKTFLETTEADIANIAFTLGVGRDQHPYRLSWIVRNIDDLRTQVSHADPTLFQGEGYCRIPMPGYVFETKSYWFDQDPVPMPTREVAHA